MRRRAGDVILGAFCLCVDISSEKGVHGGVHGFEAGRNVAFA